VTTDFQLLARLQREQVWELVTAGSVAVLLLTAAGSTSGPWFSTALVLAASTDVGPAAALGRAVLSLPLAILLPGSLPRQRAVGPPLLPTPAPDEAAPALMAVYSHPPWTVRLTWLAHLAYLPLLLMLAAELVT
jgi:hypothetical protein